MQNLTKNGENSLSFTCILTHSSSLKIVVFRVNCRNYRANWFNFRVIMSGITLSRRRKFPPDGLKLRRLTQAYLAPYQQIKPEQTKAAARIDQIYDTSNY